jgi:hypothetical protein
MLHATRVYDRVRRIASCVFFDYTVFVLGHTRYTEQLHATERGLLTDRPHPAVFVAHAVFSAAQELTLAQPHQRKAMLDAMRIVQNI